MKGQSVEIRADHVWGPDRVESIVFSTATRAPTRPPTQVVPPAPRQVVRPAPCPPPTCTPVGPFRPSTNGFKFPNSFSSIPLPRPLPSIPASFGLCGGMASAALDYFLSCIPIPSTTTVPASGTLFNYLLRRQLHSLGSPTFGMIAKFGVWTNRPDTRRMHPLIPHRVLLDGLQELTVPESRATVASFRAGRPVVLGLIRVGPGSVSINNHQVLAYGLAHVSGGPGLTAITDIRIYDPNYPMTDGMVIRCEFVRGPWHRVRCVQVPARRGEKVRGFFRVPYTRKTPPCLP